MTSRVSPRKGAGRVRFFATGARAMNAQGENVGGALGQETRKPDR